MTITPKLSTTYITLAIVVLGTSATLMMTAMTTTTAAFAQPAQQQRGGGACPEGFQMNRGICQAEPEYSCQFLLDEGFPPQRIQLTNR